jgi:hypothetical protein
MTVLTLPAQPNQDVTPRPVEWRRMIWVTWRQHRAMLISLTAVLGAVAIFLLVMGLWVHRNFMNLAPALIGAFTGPAVMARELESGTFRYAWTQGIGRVRWTIAKLALLGVVITVMTWAFSQLLAWFFAPFLTTQNMTFLTPMVFDTRGVSYAAWTLTAFCLGAFLGTLLRRILPAMAATLGVYVALAAATWFYLRIHYPVSTFWPMQFFEAGWLLVLSVLLIAGTVRLVRGPPY